MDSDKDDCTEECRSDADCPVDLKCCNTNCGSLCSAPYDPRPASLVTTSQPAYTPPPTECK